MKTTAFTPITVRDFSVNDAHAVIQTTIEYAQPVKDSLENLAQISLTNTITNNKAMGYRMNLTTKSTETSEVVKEDMVRDRWWSEIRNDVKTASRSPDTRRKAAGEALKIFFTPYWNLNKKPLGTETDTIIEMLEKLDASPTLTAQAASIGIAPKLASLKASNARLQTIYSTRTTTQAANTGPSASSLKANAAVSYNQFCCLIELAHTLAPNDTIKTLFNNIEQVRKKYAAIYNVANKDNPDDDTPDDTNGDAPA